MDDMEFLKQLNEQQVAVCIEENNIVLKACPGSGKTRTLTYKLAYLVRKYETSRKLNIAITYTNRAADEIKERLEKLHVQEDTVWAGTIHQFCLEYIIRPYSMYHDRLKKGYYIIDEYVKEKYIKEIAKDLNIELGYNNPFDFAEIEEAYKKKLLSEKEIDFEDILLVAFELVSCNEFICKNIAGIIRTILVDEYQDTNELQYHILSEIVKKNQKIIVTFVGDTDQAIYGGLGGVAKSKKELEIEFGITFNEKKLDGCYRSTQRIIDYYSNFQLTNSKIYGVSNIKDESGTLQYDNTIMNDDLFEKIASIVKREIDEGIPEKEICIIAPQWWLLFPLSKQMKTLLPDVNFDAPDITPIKYDPMNAFYLISRLVFTEAGSNTWLRKKIANEIINILIDDYKISLPSSIDSFRVLKIINANQEMDADGIICLQRDIENFFSALYIDLGVETKLAKAYHDFIEKIQERAKKNQLSTERGVFEQCFKEKDGVVINTFHGVKGEEYNTVIAFGILNGYIPHWDLIWNKPQQYREDETKKLLYVVCSRAKKKLYLFSEQGRITKKGDVLTPTNEIKDAVCYYDK